MNRKQVTERDGFSLVEMIIVIAVMAVLVGTIALSYNLLRAADTKGAANEINSGLSDLKSKSMATNKTIYMHLYQLNGTYYIAYSEDETFTPTEEALDIGDDSMQITYKDESGVVHPVSMVHIKMQKKDGAFAQAPTEITVSADRAPTRTVHLIKDTGKHYVED